MRERPPDRDESRHCNTTLFQFSNMLWTEHTNVSLVGS
jgi:hypothetical protein